MKPGQIIGIFGAMGSGKTALAIVLCRNQVAYTPNIKIYTNIPNTPGTIHITKASQLPIDTKPKILLLDEIMFTMDSRAFSSQNNKLLSRLLAYLRKINTTLVYATHDPGMVDIRLRQHTQYAIFMKDQGEYFTFMAVDCMTEEKNIYHIYKSEEYFKYANYDTLAFADEFIVDLTLKTGKNFKLKD